MIYMMQMLSKERKEENKSPQLLNAYLPLKGKPHAESVHTIL